MNRRSRIVRPLALAAVAAAALGLASTAPAADPARPHRGSCTTVVTPVTPPDVVPQELHIASDCILTHLGHASGHTQQFVTPTGQSGPILTLLITNTTTYMAADGDLLAMSFAGTGQLNVVSGEVTFTGTETYTGGSGRFAGASGSAGVEGGASIFTNAGFFTAKGRIAY